MSFAKQVAITVGANGGLAVLNFASGTLAARLLGPTGRGELAAIQTWAGFLATVATLGLTEAVVLFCAREPNRAGRYISSAVVLGLIGCAPMLLLSYLLMPILVVGSSAADRPCCPLVSGPCGSLCNYRGSVWRAALATRPDCMERDPIHSGDPVDFGFVFRMERGKKKSGFSGVAESVGLRDYRGADHVLGGAA